MQFRIWLEESQDKQYIFLDMDQTLVHRVETGWLKDSPENSDYAPLLISGKHPYPEIKSIKSGDKTFHVFPRPRLKEFLEVISDLANIYIITHAKQDYCDKIISKYELHKWIKGCFSTGLTEPGELADKFKLNEAKWLLIDNMNINSIEIINKMRILGIMFPDERDAHSEGEKIVRAAREHFIQVKDWYPQVDEHADNELFRIMPDIREKLGLLN